MQSRNTKLGTNVAPSELTAPTLDGARLHLTAGGINNIEIPNAESSSGNGEVGNSLGPCPFITIYKHSANESGSVDQLPISHRLQRGALLAGKYRVDKVIGCGGMAFVTAAYDIELRRKVAIKVPRPQALQGPRAVERFVAEGETLAKIQSEHVARVFEIGTVEAGVPYLAMEYLEGADARSTLAEHGPLPTCHSVEIIAQACEALGAAHDLGIVHLDVKPENLFCSYYGDGTLCIKSSRLRDFKGRARSRFRCHSRPDGGRPCLRVATVHVTRTAGSARPGRCPLRHLVAWCYAV